MFICIICQATCRSYLNISSSFEITLNVLRGGSPSYHRYLWWLLLGVLLVSHKWAESDGVNERWYILLFPYTYLFWFFFFLEWDLPNFNLYLLFFSNLPSTSFWTLWKFVILFKHMARWIAYFFPLIHKVHFPTIIILILIVLSLFQVRHNFDVKPKLKPLMSRFFSYIKIVFSAKYPDN